MRQNRQSAAGDQASSPLVGKIGPGPVQEHRDSISKADQKIDVNQKPGEPGEETAQMQAAQVCNPGGPPDGSHGPSVEIVKALVRLPLERALDVARDTLAHL